MARAVFLDRDGTLIHEAHYLSDPRRVRIYQGVPQALAQLRAAGYKLIVVSNQSGIGRGWVSRSAVDRVNRRMIQLMTKAGAPEFDAIYFCPHAPAHGCGCRKPRPFLVNKAVRRFRINPRHSFVIGDKMSDIGLARRVGSRAVLLLTGHGRKEWTQMRRGRVTVDYVAQRFSQAANWILVQTEKYNKRWK